MNEAIQKKYDQRMKDYNDAINVRVPEHILVQSDMLTAQIGLYGMTVQECLENPDKYVETCTKIYDDYAIDFVSGGLINPLEAIWSLGRDTYFVSEDGVTVQHKESIPMEANEYSALINDPMDFIVNTLFPRKFPTLMQEYPKSYEVLKSAATKYLKFLTVSGKYSNYAKEHYGVLSTAAAKSYPPFDVIFDRLRGFAGTMKDIRRQAEVFEQACEALLPIYMMPLQNLSVKIPHAVTTLHSPEYLRTSDFEKYFWPTYKKMLLFAFEKGSTTLAVGEGPIDRYYDLFLELPKGSIVLVLQFHQSWL